MRWVLAAGVAAGLTFALLPLIKRLPHRPNYRGRPVGLGGGPAVVAGAAAGWLAFGLIPAPGRPEGLIFLATLVMAGLGWLDDCWGEGKTKGFRGHFRRWWQGRGDTALLKAAGGLALGLAVARRSAATWWEAALAVLLVSLAANALNLLDLRPGRALKGFALGLALLFLLGAPTAPLFVPVLAAVLAYAPYDLRERLMLGDAGANALGAALGTGAALGLSPPAETVLAFTLVALHVYAEKGSLTRLIERVGWLRLLDSLGRRG
ncbi:MAG: hypothetical protein H5U00_13000 [Clostridia bacterium]|nr:hypothetical protein [Clostridia bacterium]